MVRATWLSLGLACLGLTACVTARATGSPAPTAASDGSGVDRETYARGGLQRLPIGVFDSGIGGLTVLDAILRLDDFDNRTQKPGPDGIPDFANERFQYFGDQANMPYGNYPSAGKIGFLRELIVEDALFLVGRRYFPSVDAARPAFDKPPVKAVVIACNTATAYGWDDVRSALRRWQVPVPLVGVVEAGAEGAVRAGADGAVAVMATSGTCRSEIYPRTIERVAKQRGTTPPHVVQEGSVGLAGAIEGDPAFVSSAATYKGPAVTNSEAPLDAAHLDRYGFDPAGMDGDIEAPASLRLRSIENYVRYDVATLAEDYRKKGGTTPIATVVLGCTHFPFQKDRIAAAFERLRTYRDADGNQPYATLIAPHLTFVDPAQLTAHQLYVTLRDQGGLSQEPVPGENAFFISKPNPAAPGVRLTTDGAFDAKYKYSRPEGERDHETVKRVPLRASDLSPPVQALVQKAMPAVWNAIHL